MNASSAQSQQRWKAELKDLETQLSNSKTLLQYHEERGEISNPNMDMIKEDIERIETEIRVKKAEAKAAAPSLSDSKEKPNKSGSSKRPIEQVDGAMENGATKKGKLTKKELRAKVKKFVDYYESLRTKTVASVECEDEKELELRCQSMHMLLQLWQTRKFVDGEETFTRDEVRYNNFSECNLTDEVIDANMKVAEGLKWIDGNDDKNKFTIDFTTVFEAVPGYLDYMLSVQRIIENFPVDLRKDNPFFQLLLEWDGTCTCHPLYEQVALAVRYIALESGDIERGLVRALKDEKFKLCGVFTDVERDLVCYLAVEKYKVGAYYILSDDDDDYESSDSEDEVPKALTKLEKADTNDVQKRPEIMYDMSQKENRMKLIVAIQLWGSISGLSDKANMRVWSYRLAHMCCLMDVSTGFKDDAMKLTELVSGGVCEGDTTKGLMYVKEELKVFDRLASFYATYYHMSQETIDVMVEADKQNFEERLAYESMIHIRLGMISGELPPDIAERLKNEGMTSWENADEDARVKEAKKSKNSL